VLALLLRVHLAAEHVDLLAEVVDLLLIPGLDRRGGEGRVDDALLRLVHGPGALRERHGRDRERRNRDPLPETVHRPSPEERPDSGPAAPVETDGPRSIPTGSRALEEARLLDPFAVAVTRTASHGPPLEGWNRRPERGRHTGGWGVSSESCSS